MQEEPQVRTALSKVAPLRREALTVEIERELVDRAKNGSADAFGQLVERYHTRVFRTAYNITRHHEDAEDVMQNTFLKAFDKLSLFHGDSRFSTWLVSIAINEGFHEKASPSCYRGLIKRIRRSRRRGRHRLGHPDLVA
jgi:hypothetical protein